MSGLTFADKAEIAEKLHLYCFGVSGQNREMLNSIAFKDADVNFDPLYKGKWASFVDYLIGSHVGLLFSDHSMTNILIKGSTDVASSESVVLGLILARKPDESVIEIEFRSRYLDKWRREDGQWRIAERTLVRDYRKTTGVSAGDLAARYQIAQH